MRDDVYRALDYWLDMAAINQEQLEFGFAQILELPTMPPAAQSALRRYLLDIDNAYDVLFAALENVPEVIIAYALQHPST